MILIVRLQKQNLFMAFKRVPDGSNIGSAIDSHIQCI